MPDKARQYQAILAAPLPQVRPDLADDRNVKGHTAMNGYALHALHGGIEVNFYRGRVDHHAPPGRLVLPTVGLLRSSVFGLRSRGLGAVHGVVAGMVEAPHG